MGAIDETMSKWEELKAAVTGLYDSKNLNEIFFRRKEILDKKKETKAYFDEYLR